MIRRLDHAGWVETQSGYDRGTNLDRRVDTGIIVGAVELGFVERCLVADVELVEFVEQQVEGDLGFQSGQRGSEAEVDAVAECEVAVGRTANVEAFRAKFRSSWFADSTDNATSAPAGTIVSATTTSRW